jgi:hypothetical protein
MTAGQNLRCTIWRMATTSSDDAIGGAMITGSSVYTGKNIRLEEQPVQQLLLQQGLETVKTFEATLTPGDLVVYERDEIEITFPIEDIRYGNRYRIINVRPSSFNTRDPRSYIGLTLVRSVRAHKQQ